MRLQPSEEKELRVTSHGQLIYLKCIIDLFCITSENRCCFAGFKIMLGTEPYCCCESMTPDLLKEVCPVPRFIIISPGSGRTSFGTRGHFLFLSFSIFTHAYFLFEN